MKMSCGFVAFLLVLSIICCTITTGCEEMLGTMTGNWGACTHLDGGCTEHSYESECYEAGGVKWWADHRC